MKCVKSSRIPAIPTSYWAMKAKRSVYSTWSNSTAARHNFSSHDDVDLLGLKPVILCTMFGLG